MPSSANTRGRSRAAREVSHRVYVTTAAEAASLDARTIAGGIASGELMRRAGEAAAREIERSLAARLPAGACVFAGPGNNGGDGWVVARVLAQRGVPVRVIEADEAKTEDTRAARREAQGARVERADGWSDEAVIIDALLGTGATGVPRARTAVCVAEIVQAREKGAAVVALDVPTGVDATTGAAARAVSADLTITFGTMKRGLLSARESCGRIVVADIGLATPDPADSLPELVVAEWVYRHVPSIPAAAHKGSRGGITVIGGAPGMAGAAILAARGALRAGAGSARLCVAEENVTAAHVAVPPALVTPWQKVLGDPAKFVGSWPEGVAIGPGLGKSDTARALLDALLENYAGPFVVDADALNLLAGRLDEFRERVSVRAPGVRAVLTPHPAEMKRLLGDGRETTEVNAQRYEIVVPAARRAGAVVLLKGVPTLIAFPDGRRRVSATGTPALATGGAGDVLSGIIATLLAQSVEPFDAAAIGAWVHGRAAELATGGGISRGVMLDDVVERLRDVWDPPSLELPEGVLAELPAVR